MGVRIVLFPQILSFYQQFIAFVLTSRRQALKHIVAVSKSTEKSQSNLRVKLYFIGTVMSKGDEKLSAILEVREILPVFCVGDILASSVHKQ